MEHCCCCISLQTGALLIGSGSLIVYILAFLLTIFIENEKPNGMNLYDYPYPALYLGYYVVSAFFGLFLLLGSAAKSVKMVLFWLLSQLVIYGAAIFHIIDEFHHNARFAYRLLLVLLLSLYFYFIILSYYYFLKKRTSGQMRRDNA